VIVKSDTYISIVSISRASRFHCDEMRLAATAPLATPQEAVSQARKIVDSKVEGTRNKWQAPTKRLRRSVSSGLQPWTRRNCLKETGRAYRSGPSKWNNRCFHLFVCQHSSLKPTQETMNGIIYLIGLIVVIIEVTL
jgi:hypothetical protein